MSKQLFLYLCLFAVIQINAQTKYSTSSDEFIDFHSKVSAAERMYKNDSLLQAYAKFDVAFNSYTGQINPSHYFKAAVCALKIKEEFKALHFLEKAIKGGYDIDSNKIAVIVFFNKNTKTEYLTNIKSWEIERDAKRNATWENELYAYNEGNKKYATPAYKTAIEYCTACLKNKTCSKTSPEYTSKYKMIKEKRKADSLIAINLISNIKLFGFPNMKLVDKKACGFACTILLNYDSDKKNEILNSMLAKAMIDGEVSPEFYATLIDRRNLMNGLAPNFFEPITGYEKSLPKDIAVANEKRKSIGLYPVMIPLANAKAKDVKAPKKIITTLYDY